MYLDLTGASAADNSADRFQSLSPRDKTASLLSRIKYFTRKTGTVEKPDLITHWVIADLDVPKGRELLKHALEQMVISCSSFRNAGLSTDFVNFVVFAFQRTSAGIRVAVIVNPSSTEVTPLTELILTSLDVLPSDVAAHYISKILENEQVFESLDGFKRPPNFNLPVNFFIMKVENVCKEKFDPSFYVPEL